MKTALALLFISISFVSYSQTKALTENGDEVVLYMDGTWAYYNEQDISEHILLMNPKEFSKSEDASFLLKSKVGDIGIYFNPKNWKVTNGGSDSDSEYDFSLKNQEAYATFISERTYIPLETLRLIAFENAAAVSTDLVVESEEKRMVNSLEMIMMKMTGSIQGMKFTYFGYYYSKKGVGSFQFISYTSQEFYSEYEVQLEELLNGLTEVVKEGN